MTCPTKLIDDLLPSKDDLASHGKGEGAHERIAHAMADLIRSSDVGGKLIGLEGGWGSGKSTVINLMTKSLKQTPETTVFIFDSWAHEREPLRRSFLESLIRHFQKRKWIAKKPWNAKIEQFSNRRTVTRSHTNPRPTRFGTWLALSALVVPIGTSLVAGSLNDGLQFDPDLPINWGLLVGALLSASPILAVLLNGVRVVLSKGNVRNGRVTSSGWELLTGRTTETTTEATETHEPTSIEFEETFKCLMKTALGKNDRRRAILVLDNLDRVNYEDARKLWSTLQTFLQYRTVRTPAWFKKVWIIVPYDKSGLSLLWQSPEAAHEKEATRAPTGAAESFLDKSLQVNFEVPPPVLSTWRFYLAELVERAIPRHKQDAHDLYRIYLHCVAKQDGTPTPRQLKLYVNQIGALHLQWPCEAKGAVPVRHLAYYAALRRANWTSDQLRRRLVNERKVPWEPALNAVLSGQLRANLAGLLFNVRADVGEQLLLTEPILKALSESDGERLTELERIHKDGFWVVLDDMIVSHAALADPATMCSAMLGLNSSGLLESANRPEVLQTVQDINEVVSRMEIWSPAHGQYKSCH